MKLGAVQFLIRTRHEDAWTNDGIFGPLEAIAHIEAFRENGGKINDIRVYLLHPHGVHLEAMTTVSARRVSDGVWGYKWYNGTTNVFFTK